MKIAYIFSMKKGISPFIYSELEELEKEKIKFKIFPTKLSTGLKEPKENWNIVKFNPILTIVKQPFFLIKSPIKYTKLLVESIFTGSIMNFLIATSIKEDMSDLDHIHCHFGDNKFFIGYYASKWVNKPLSVTIHAHELYRNKWKIFQKSLEHAKKIITISEFNRKIIEKKFNIPNDKIFVNRMFVNTDEFKIRDKIKILIVAFFHKKKGHEYLFKAIKRTKIKNLEVWVVGGNIPGYADVNIEGLAKKIGIEDKVCIFGVQSGNSLKALYNECDIFCLPSISLDTGEAEGLPVSLMEAMSFSKPVISTYHVGIPELVETELVKEKDITGLAKKIDKLAKISSERKRQGERNRKKIEIEYSPRNAKSFVRILKKK